MFYLILYEIDESLGLVENFLIFRFARDAGAVVKGIGPLRPSVIKKHERLLKGLIQDVPQGLPYHKVVVILWRAVAKAIQQRLSGRQGRVICRDIPQL